MGQVLDNSAMLTLEVFIQQSNDFFLFHLSPPIRLIIVPCLFRHCESFRRRTWQSSRLLRRPDCIGSPRNDREKLFICSSGQGISPAFHRKPSYNPLRRNSTSSSCTRK